jgi:hypothetical protein
MSDPVIMSVEEMENLFRTVVLTIFHLDPEGNDSRVRFPWSSNISEPAPGSAPGWNRNEDVCFVYSLPLNNSYNMLRDTNYIDEGGMDLTALDEHTDTHRMEFVNYGPHAYDCARDIRDGLFLPSIRRLLALSHFALVTDVPAIMRVPELIDGVWWNRVDVQATFNEFVRRPYDMPTLQKIVLKVKHVAPDETTATTEKIIERGSNS